MMSLTDVVRRVCVCQVKSMTLRLETSTRELEKEQAARSDLERRLQREQDEWSRARTRLEHECTQVKDKNQVSASLHQQAVVFQLS